MTAPQAPREKKNYDIRPLEVTPEALREVLDLFVRGGSGISGDWSFLDWQYNQNPAGSAIGFNAYHEGKLAAHYATIPVKAMLFGRECPGILSINTRTDAEHQGQGLFTRLAALTYDRARELGKEFVVGVANQNSVHGFVKKLGFQHVGLLDTRMVATLPPVDPRPLEYQTCWDAASVAWRLANPTRKAGYHVQRHGSRAFLFGRSNRFRALVGEVAGSAVPAGVAPLPAALNPFSLWIGLGSGFAWGRSVNLRVPQRFKSTPLNFIFRDLTGTRTLDPSAVRFWAMDFDAY